jgi:ketosteroid isomerase-like protein
MDVAHEHPLDPPELRQARREPAAFSRLNRDIPLSRRTRPAGGLELIFISPRRGTPPMMILKFSTVILVPALAVSAPLLLATPTEAQATYSEDQSDASLAVVMDFLSNTAPDKVEAAALRLVAPDAVYVSLNFDNPELRKIEPWAGTARGPSAYSDTFLQVAEYWEIEDFTISDKLASGEDVAIFGQFTYRSVEVGNVFTSPFSIHAKVRNGQMVYFQFLEDTYASASSFRQSGSWTVKTTKATSPFEVGAE